MADKYRTLDDAIWADPFRMDMFFIVYRRGTYRRFTSPNAAVIYARTERYNHTARYWGVDHSRLIEGEITAGQLMRVVGKERELNFYKDLKVAAN